MVTRPGSDCCGLKYYLCPSRKSSLFFNRPCIPSPIKPRIRSAKAKVGSVDAISVLSTASIASLSEYQRPTTKKGINKILSPMQSITTNTVDIIVG
ncbi:MAG TPA: hypothetical protein VFS97_05095 [Nitrososphaeraceae archaeon]|nr:hypothetical protein [Nitrososphaeraceae archaeon]